MEKGQKFKGVATLWPDGKVDFRPQTEGKSQQQGLKETKNSKLYQTTGKSPKLVAHLSIDSKTTDWRRAMLDELDAVLPPAQSALPGNPQGRLLLNDDDLVITLGDDRKLMVRIDIDAATVVDMDSHIFKLLTRINTCLAFNRTLLKPQNRA